MEKVIGFIENGVYVLKSASDRESIFVCLPVLGGGLGKLVRYVSEDPRLPNATYEKTGMAYFIDNYIDGDFRAMFLNPENYEMIGMLGNNYYLSEDTNQTYILRGN